MGDSNDPDRPRISIASRRNISYPYGDSNSPNAAEIPSRTGNISYPYGDSNALVFRTVLHVFLGNISYPYGDSNLDAATAVIAT